MPAESPADLYLDLLKRTLSFCMWPEPPQLVTFETRPFPRRQVGNLLSNFLTRFTDLKLAVHRPVTAKQRELGEVWPGYAHTMVGLKRLDSLQECVETVLKEKIPGDLIETGVWRGGSCIFMKGVLQAHGDQDRTVYVADSFAGLPKPNPEEYPEDEGDNHHKIDFLAISEEQVRENFEKYDLLDDRVRFLKGWFKDTLPTAPAKAYSVIRLDGDMYESTMDGLVNLYPKLSPGGFCIIDDYSLSMCASAVSDYRKEHGITEELVAIDNTAKFWRKAK